MTRAEHPAQAWHDANHVTPEPVGCGEAVATAAGCLLLLASSVVVLALFLWGIWAVVS